jgi:uncharacterized membrane protein
MAVTPGDPPRRREHLDWLRGVAVLLMIEAHLFDSWTAVPDRDGPTFSALMMVGGAGTTLFLFLAGVSVALSGGAKLRRTGRAGAAANAVAWRGLQIFALAFLFRLQAWILGWSDRPMDLLRVDILNIMGPSIVAAALLWRLGQSDRGRVLVFAAGTAAIAFLTPVIRTLPPGALPQPVLAYIVPVAGLSNFVIFPWTAMVLAGACVGVLIETGQTPAIDQRVQQQLAIGGAILSVGAFAASFLPTPFAASEFWTTSPAYLFLRCGVATLAVAGSYAWVRHWSHGSERAHWSAVTQLGRTSLFIYWIHVELIYGLISRPWHRSLTVTQAFGAYVAFCGLMLACSLAKERIVRHFSRPEAGRGQVAEASVAPAPVPRRSPPSVG